MTRTTFLGVIGILLGLSALSVSTPSGAARFGDIVREGAQEEATQRRVQGIVTSVEDGTVTITPLRGRSAGVTGRIDPGTRVVVDGRAAKANDVSVSFRARGELGLDDVWATLVVDSH